ncbi:hypothetical protein [Serratia quinivorans]|uniref:hypothetical protein n=1 Tax=Serratia quinivorans TaxID=137545 RepID=UPI0021B7CFF8|nr:hypothetical protein [Serratia quinivorans]
MMISQIDQATTPEVIASQSFCCVILFTTGTGCQSVTTGAYFRPLIASPNLSSYNLAKAEFAPFFFAIPGSFIDNVVIH